jgi:hypothetical protein
MSYNPNNSNGQAAAANSLPVTLSNENVQDLYFIGQSAQTATVNNIIPAAVSSSATDLTGYRSASIQIICPAGTYTTGTIIFEGSNDNSNFITLPVWNQLILTGTPITAAITLVTTTFIVYTFPVTTRYLRVRISTAVSGASASVQSVSKFSQTSWVNPVTQIAQAAAANLNVTALLASITTSVVPGTAATNLGKARNAAAGATDTGTMALVLRNDVLTTFGTTANYTTPTADKYGNLIIKDQQKHKRTYSTSFTVALAAAATDIFQLIGSASTNVQVTKIILSGIQTTAGLVLISLSKRSTANAGGTSTAPTLVPHESTDAAATAVGAVYTANPTPGSAVGNIRSIYVPLGSATANCQPVEINLAERGKPCILAGVAQAIAINLNGVTVTGGTMAITVEFTEE